MNTDATIALTAKLERLNRSAFPNAVRSTLNDAAFQMKKEEILNSAKRNMEVKNEAFFKKYTGVEKAKGFEVNSMGSVVGFSGTNEKKAKKALEGMKQNEYGGTDDTGMMYTKNARIGKSADSLVRTKDRWNKSKMAKGYKMSKKGKSNVKKMVSSFWEKKPVAITVKSGIRYLLQVTDADYNMVEKKTKFKIKVLARTRGNGLISRANATHFNKEAALKTKEEMDEYFLKNATYQFQKVLK